MEVEKKGCFDPFLKLSLLYVFIFSLAAGVTAIPAQASEGIVIHDTREIEGYHITVLAKPNPITVGKIALLVRIARPGLGNQEVPARGAKMLVEFYHLSGPGADNTSSYLQRRDLEALESDPGNYEVADSLQNEGEYRITLKIQDGTRQIEAPFQITARPQPEDRFISVLLISLFPIFVAWLVWMYLKKPGPAPSKDEDRPESSSETPAEAAGETRR